MHPLEQDLDHVLEHTADLWPDLCGERIFLTGGTSFVGTWLLESFMLANQKLNLRAKAVVLSRRPPATPEHAAVEFLTGDGSSFRYPTGNFSFLIHAANDDSYSQNIQITQRVLNFAATHQTKRFLFTSSGAVYGTQPPEITNIFETYNRAPLTTYGQSKVASEDMCTEFGAIIARLFAFVGPYLPLDANYAAGNFIGNTLRSEPIRIKGDGTPYRSYLYATDLAIWLWTMLLRGEPGEAYNVGSPNAISIQALAQAVVENTKPGTPIEIAEIAQPGVLPSRYVPSTARAEQLGLKVLIPLADGIRRTYNWHRR